MLMGKNKVFSVFIKSRNILYCFSWVVYSRLKAFGKKRENKTHGRISQSAVGRWFSTLLRIFSPSPSDVLRVSLNKVEMCNT